MNCGKNIQNNPLLCRLLCVDLGVMRDKKTNKRYNPKVEFDKVMNSIWFKKIVIRMGSEVNIKKTLVD
jgi:hypothetical protein